MPDIIEPLSPTASYFDLLGVPVGVSDAELTARFHELSRRYHPDRWATADAATQVTALDSTALINDAYRTLRDPFTRAEYLLRRERGGRRPEGDPLRGRPDDTHDQKPPQELFARVLELQEALLEYQEAQADDDTEARERLRPALLAAQSEFQETYTGMASRLNDLFARWDAGEDRATLLDELAQIVGTRGYLHRVLSNLDKTLTG